VRVKFHRLRYFLWLLKMSHRAKHRIKNLFWFLKMSFTDVFSWNGETIIGRFELVKEDWADMKTKNYFLEDPILIQVTESLLAFFA